MKGSYFYLYTKIYGCTNKLQHIIGVKKNTNSQYVDAIQEFTILLAMEGEGDGYRDQIVTCDVRVETTHKYFKVQELKICDESLKFCLTDTNA